VTRLSPFELAFGTRMEERFSEIPREAESESKDPSDPGQFASLRSVQHLMGEIESPEAIEADPRAAVEYLTLLYVASRYWDAGQSTRYVDADLFSEERVARLLRGIPVSVPGGGCYLQLPERLVWSQIGPTAPHEPLDGLFAAESRDRRQFTVVAVLGLRPDRHGFSQISFSVSTSDLAELPGMMRSPPFAPVMDGGVAAGFKSVTSAGELLLLAQLALVRTAE